MTKAAAIQAFYSSFGLEAFEENALLARKDMPEFPYISYEFSTDSFDYEIPLTLNLWYRSEKWVDINAKTEEISKAISRGGKIIPCDGGAIWIKRGSPFARSMGDESDNLIKRKVINVIVEYLTAD